MLTRVFVIAFLIMVSSSCVTKSFSIKPDKLRSKKVATVNSDAFFEHFDSYTYFDSFWENASQNNSPKSYSLENSHLKIITRPEVWDRIKIKTKRADFGLGTYTWRVYVPKMTIGDKASIGAFIYLDDQHELDFEIGSGKHYFREKLGVKPDELLVYCTSQSLPHSSDALLIKHDAWYNLKIQVSENETDKYVIKWFVNDELLKTLTLAYGKAQRFSVYCSLENLDFIGNKLPEYPHFTLFDWFKYEPLDLKKI